VLVVAAIITQNNAAASVPLSGLKSLPAFTLGFVASTSVGPVQSDLLSLRGERRGRGVGVRKKKKKKEKESGRKGVGVRKWGD
jgi:hypothetical protein